MTSDGGYPLRRRGEDRAHQFPRRERRVLLRLSDREYNLVQGAAWRDGYTMAGYAAEATLAAAGGHLVAAGNDADRAALREALAELMVARTAVNRFGANVNQRVKFPTSAARGARVLSAVPEQSPVLVVADDGVPVAADGQRHGVGRAFR